MSTAILRIGGDGQTIIRGDPIANLDYFSAVDGQLKNGKRMEPSNTRVD